MIRTLAAAFFCLCFILPLAAASAQDTPDTPAAIGTVAEVEGAAAVTSGGAQKELKVGSAIYTGDVVETAAGAKVLILFIDDTELTVAENAQLTIDEYVFDEEDAAANKGRFSFARGAFIFVSGLIGKTTTPDVEIATPYGSIGLRGTTVWGGELDDAYNVFVQDGSVKFSTERGTVTVAAGEGTSVASRRAIPVRAKAWGQEKIGRAVKTVALANPDGVKLRIGEFRQRHPEMRVRYRENIKKKAMNNPGTAAPQKRIENKPQPTPQTPPRQQPQPPQKSGAAVTPQQDPQQQQPRPQRQPGQPGMQAGQKPAPSGNAAADFERREKMHLDGFGSTPGGSKAPPPNRSSLPSGR